MKQALWRKHDIQNHQPNVSWNKAKQATENEQCQKDAFPRHIGKVFVGSGSVQKPRVLSIDRKGIEIGDQSVAKQGAFRRICHRAPSRHKILWNRNVIIQQKSDLFQLGLARFFEQQLSRQNLIGPFFVSNI
jgi:hypothetical protein